MAINKEADFIMKDGRAIYPPVISDESLKLWYDTKGKKNSDKYKDKMFDMSGNKNHGTLENFDYKNLSGYQKDSELVFDGIEDKLVLGDVEKPEIISATKNLFDPQKEIVATQGSYTLSWEVDLKPNTSYTVSTNAPRTTGSDVFFDNKGTRPSSNINGVKDTAPRTLTTDSSGIVWVSTRQTVDTTGITNIDNVRSGEFWIQLEEGSTATPYVPYIPSIRGTYQLNNNIISYDRDTARWVKDGKVMERKGVNLIRTENYSNAHALSVSKTGGIFNISHVGTSVNTYLFSSSFDFTGGHKYYFAYKGMALTEGLGSFRIYANGSYLRPTLVPSELNTWYHLERTFEGDESNLSSFNIRLFFNEPISKAKVKVKDVQLIDLTATFGAGNEPTLEEIQAEPNKWQWLPNPLDLSENEELKGNILGDMEDTIDDHTRDEQSGVEVFTDKADDSLVRVEVDGVSCQHAGSGKNLISSSEPVVGATYGSGHRPYNITEYYYEKETATLSYKTKSAYTGVGLTAKVEPNIQYTFHFERIQNVQRSSIHYYDSEGNLKDIASSYANPKTFTTPNDCYEVVLTPIPTSSIEENDLIIAKNLQLEEGSIATEYEPPAPTPDYPIEIHSSNDFDVVSSVGNRNLLPATFDKFVTDAGTYDFYKLTDGNIALTITVTDKDPSVDLAGTYFGLTSSGHSYTNPARWAFAGGAIQHTQFTITGANYFSIYGGNKHKIFDRFYIKIEKGSNATSWTPAPEDITEDDNHPLIDKINLLLSEPLRSVGDVKDRLFRDSDGLWKVERKILNTKIEGNGKSWYLLDRNTNEKQDSYESSNAISHLNPDLSGRLLSTHFKRAPGYNASNPNIGEIKYSQSGYVAFTVNKGTFPSLQSMKNWIDSENLEMQLVADTPTTKTLPDELQDKLNNIASFKDSNYVYTIINDKTDILPSHVSENLKPMIHTDFLSKDHYKENRTVNNLLIWNRSLEDEELLNQNKLFHERFNMRSNTIKGEPINQEINLLSGGYSGNTLSLDYEIKI